MKDVLLSLSCFDLLAVISKLTKSSSVRYKEHESEPLKGFLQTYDATDIQREMSDVISSVFSKNNKFVFNSEIRKTLDTIRKEAIEVTHPSFGDLEFLQNIVAKALWQYEIELDPNLEIFAREFDRIDDNEERLRLICRLRNT